MAGDSATPACSHAHTRGRSQCLCRALPARAALRSRRSPSSVKLKRPCRACASSRSFVHLRELSFGCRLPCYLGLALLVVLERRDGAAIVALDRTCHCAVAAHFRRELAHSRRHRQRIPVLIRRSPVSTLCNVWYVSEAAPLFRSMALISSEAVLAAGPGSFTTVRSARAPTHASIPISPPFSNWRRAARWAVSPIQLPRVM